MKGRACWLVRIAYALVFLINVHCAISFIVVPQGFVGAYELAGVPGLTAVQGMGVAFLMWNATYPVVIVDPIRFRAVGIIVLVQQAIGLAGESLILYGLPAGHATLAAAITRFICFDAVGLVVMCVAMAALLLALKRAG